ncbi:hypothetical protein AZZ75_004118, partial [Klebsiella pneumoniae]
AAYPRQPAATRPGQRCHPLLLQRPGG